VILCFVLWPCLVVKHASVSAKIVDVGLIAGGGDPASGDNLLDKIVGYFRIKATAVLGHAGIVDDDGSPVSGKVLCIGGPASGTGDDGDLPRAPYSRGSHGSDRPNANGGIVLDHQDRLAPTGS